jgi:Cytochrome c554 and c-prime
LNRFAIGLLIATCPTRAALECGSCHAAIATSFAATAHANASRPASVGSILGPFDPKRSTMLTRVPGVYFQMEKRAGGFYQTAFEAGRSHTERFDLVIGSGRRGQSYLYWREGLLFQLPVSYHVGSQRWINSPGYEDGKVNFGRGIPPQCLDCHTSRFRLERVAGGLRYAEDYVLGIGCGKCHGEGDRHEQLTRPSGIDICARCHSGLEEEKPPDADVHGNQVGLLKASRCFQRSGSMTCTTCHDVHRMERDPAVLVGRCVACHTRQACPTGLPQCVECHMPVLASKVIEVQAYRTHRIGVYRKK